MDLTLPDSIRCACGWEVQWSDRWPEGGEHWRSYYAFFHGASLGAAKARAYFTTGSDDPGGES
jgi:hypothetical protein